MIVAFFLVTTPALRHWFVLPVLACGTIIGTDALRVVRGKLDIFDPIGFVGVIGFHFFFLAPLLHVYFGRWMQFVDSPPEWRDWLGRMAIVNLFGLAAYFLGRKIAYGRGIKNGTYRQWSLDPDRFRRYAALALVVTAALQLWVYRQFGGLTGYIASFDSGDAAFEGYGIIFSVSESFPIIAMMAFVVWASRSERRYSWFVLAIVLLIYFAVVVLFGGMRGSRGNTIWAIFWAVGLIHFWIRPVPRQLVLTGAAVLIAFMYLYGFYKSMGFDSFDVITGESSITEAEEQSGRTFQGLLLGDLARSDVQAYLLYRLESHPDGANYEYARGGTYLSGLTFMIPEVVWENRTPGKREAGTNALYGQGASERRTQLSSRAYGLAGEGMLNFGPIAVPLLYVIYGYVVGFAQQWRDRIPKGDSRLLILPFVTICAFYLLVWDLGNLVFFLFKRGAVPVSLVIASSIVVYLALRPSSVGGHERPAHARHVPDEVVGKWRSRP